MALRERRARFSIRRATLSLTLSAALLFLADGRAGELGSLAVVGGTVHTAAGKVIPDGVVVIEEGKIAAVGPRAETKIPEGLRIIPADGRAVIPGLVDLWASASSGRAAGAAGGAPDLRAGDIAAPDPEAWRGLLEEGITTAGIAPAPVRGVGGLGAVLKLADREPAGLRNVEARASSHLVLALGMVASELGPPRITTAERLDQYYALRQRFIDAKSYKKTWDGYWEAVEKYNTEFGTRIALGPLAAEEEPVEETTSGEKKDEGGAAEKKPEERKAEEKKPKPPERPKADPEKEVLLRALDGTLPVVVVAHHKADIGYALRLKEEFSLDLVVAGAAEGYRAVAELAAAKVQVVVGPLLLDRWSIDLLDHRESNAGDLSAAGVPVALSSLGGAAFPSPALRLSACVAVRGGLSPQKALRAITAEPAAALGLDGRLGSIEAGKDGDLVILDGDPLSALSRVLAVIAGGRVAFAREREL